MDWSDVHRRLHEDGVHEEEATRLSSVLVKICHLRPLSEEEGRVGMHLLSTLLDSGRFSYADDLYFALRENRANETQTSGAGQQGLRDTGFEFVDPVNLKRSKVLALPGESRGAAVARFIRVSRQEE